ncbi:transposase [Desulfonema ishimotonii]|uniref:Transposase n=1 Tax=Desulfonema ishimotonii TaxID=45657 RepID=A0A401FXD0_9BACT|nr:transposase [Desulfonema ishimotonii]
MVFIRLLSDYSYIGFGSNFCHKLFQSFGNLPCQNLTSVFHTEYKVELNDNL